MDFDAKKWLSELGDDENSAINAIVAKHKGDWDKAQETGKGEFNTKLEAFEKELTALREEKTTLASTLEQKKQESMTAEEKRVAEVDSIKEQLSTIVKEKEQLAIQRQGDMITSGLTKVAAQYKPHNIDHVVSLMKGDAVLSEGNLLVGGKSAEDYVKELKDAKGTAYLFQGEQLPGAGTLPTSQTGGIQSDLDKEILAMLK